MNILDKIIEHKRREVASRKVTTSTKQLEASELFARSPLSMRNFILREDKTGIIAEFKRRSPSKGVIHASADVVRTTTGYVNAGASALSVLTDEEFFGGTSDDLMAARKANEVPVIRKDFAIDEYQLIEARSIGADAILLIAAVLDPKTIRSLTSFAHSLGLEVLLEVHDREELLNNLEAGADMIGVNNRNLKTFEVSTAVSRALAPLIPDDLVKISESGISSPDTILELKTYGYRGFLMGENFMKRAEPGAAALEFMEALRAAERK